MAVARKFNSLPEVAHIMQKDNYVYDERNGEIILHKIGAGLKKLYLEPTARCNLECITCMRRQWPDAPDGEMSMKLFDKLLDQMTQFPDLERVHLGGFGEPLAHSRALEMIHRLTENGYRVSFNTNGTLVTEEVSRELIKSGVQAVYFSIDGLDQDMFGKIRVNGQLEEVIENIKTLRRLKQEMKVYNPKIGLEFVMMRSNVDQLAKLPMLAKELGSPEVLITNLLAYSEEMYNEVLYEVPGVDRSMGSGALAPLSWKNVEPQFQFPEPAVWPAVEQDFVLWGSMRLPRMYWGSSRRCSFIDKDAAVIRWDGMVAPCFALMYSYPYILDNRRKEVSEYSLGNIGEQDLYDIWNSPDYIRFRYKVRNYSFPSCMDCSASKTCDYADKNEDCWGNVPSCADCLWSQGIVRCP
ncbi:MAG: radical SAM protein [Bacillota bacterium]|nr:radical SAM protein [Bacillota bacterium]